MAIKFTTVSTKGGTGKTTLTVNFGAFLADLQQRVLIVDADPQPTASSYFDLVHRAPAGLSTLITEGASEDVISRTVIDNLDLIASDDPVGELRDWILHDPIGRLRLKQSLSALDDLYDIILIDTQGAVGPLQDAAVVAGDLLLSPIPPEMLSASEFLRGTISMLERLKPMMHWGAPIAPLRGIIYRQNRTVDARRIAEKLRKEFFAPTRGSVSILETCVPSTAAYTEAATHGLPVHRWEPTRRGPTPSGADTMLSLVHELLPHLADAQLPNNNVIEQRRNGV